MNLKDLKENVSDLGGSDGNRVLLCSRDGFCVANTPRDRGQHHWQLAKTKTRTRTMTKTIDKDKEKDSDNGN